MTEEQFQKKVTDLCDWLRIAWHHETDSRRSKAGFPDLVMAGPGGVLFAELKTDRGRVSPEQNEWLNRLTAAGATAVVWRPRDWDAIVPILHRIAGR